MHGAQSRVGVSLLVRDGFSPGSSGCESSACRANTRPLAVTSRGPFRRREASPGLWPVTREHTPDQGSVFHGLVYVPVPVWDGPHKWCLSRNTHLLTDRVVRRRAPAASSTPAATANSARFRPPELQGLDVQDGELQLGIWGGPFPSQPEPSSTATRLLGGAPVASRPPPTSPLPVPAPAFPPAPSPLVETGSQHLLPHAGS